MNARVKSAGLACALALVLGLTAAAAPKPASVAGTWDMSFQGRRGTMTATLTIEQDGGKIKGTLKGRRGESPLKGTVKGGKIDFTVKRETPRGDFRQEFKGTVSGDRMKGTVHMFRFDIDWTAKREKE
jgi:hypothetical protein